MLNSKPQPIQVSIHMHIRKNGVTPLLTNDNHQTSMCYAVTCLTLKKVKNLQQQIESKKKKTRRIPDKRKDAL